MDDQHEYRERTEALLKIAKVEADAKVEAADVIKRGLQAVADALRAIARKK